MVIPVTSIVAALLLMAGFFSSKTLSFNKDGINIPEESSRTAHQLPQKPNLPPLYYQYIPLKYYYRPSAGRREGRGFEAGIPFGFDSQFGGVERSEFLYILPILLVIGLGSFLIPIISTFFTAMITSNGGIGGGGCCGRRKRTGSPAKVAEKVFDVWENFEKAIEKFNTTFSVTSFSGEKSDSE